MPRNAEQRAHRTEGRRCTCNELLQEPLQTRRVAARPRGSLTQRRADRRHVAAQPLEQLRPGRGRVRGSLRGVSLCDQRRMGRRYETLGYSRQSALTLALSSLGHQDSSETSDSCQREGNSDVAFCIPCQTWQGNVRSMTRFVSALREEHALRGAQSNGSMCRRSPGCTRSRTQGSPDPFATAPAHRCGASAAGSVAGAGRPRGRPRPRGPAASTHTGTGSPARRPSRSGAAGAPRRFPCAGSRPGHPAPIQGPARGPACHARSAAAKAAKGLPAARIACAFTRRGTGGVPP